MNDAQKNSWKRRLHKVLIPKREPFWKHLRSPRTLLPFFLLLILSMVLGHLWVFEYSGLLALDAFSAKLEPKPAGHCRIVMVSREDYETYFDGVSPLDLDKLACAIGKLLDLGPAVIVVDFDTESRKFAKMDPFGQRVVWARGADADENGKIKPLDVLGNSNPPPFWGLALFPRDPDWTIREFPRYMLADNSQWMPTLHWAAVEAFCRSTSSRDCLVTSSGAAQREEGALSLQVFHSQYAFPPLSLGHFVQNNKTDPHGCTASWGNQHPSLTNPLHGKIVFLGGSYSNADRHHTPFGLRPGVEIVASATEAELDPQKPGQVGLWSSIALKLVLGIAVIACHHFLRPAYALFAVMGVLAFLVFFGTFVALYVTAYRASAVPFLAGLLIEQLYEGAEKAHDQVAHKEECARALGD